MAGNNISAIATTNAIISGLIVLEALYLLHKSYTTLKNVHVQSRRPAQHCQSLSPNPSNVICRETDTKAQCYSGRVTLGELIEEILGDGQGEDGGTRRRVARIYEDKRALSNPE